MQGQPPPEGGEDDKEREQTDDKKQKENTAYAKKMVLRLAGLMGVGGAVSMVYVFGELLLASAPHLLNLWERKTCRIRMVRVSFRPSPVVVMDCPGDDENVPSSTSGPDVPALQQRDRNVHSSGPTSSSNPRFILWGQKERPV